MIKLKNIKVETIVKPFVEHPLISWNILGVISLFIVPVLWPIFLITSLVFYSKLRKKRKLEEKAKLIKEAELYIEKAKESKALSTVKPSIFLNPGEHAFFEEQSNLKETRAVRKTGGGGVGFRVAKGVYVGGYSGQAESHQEWRTLDAGELIVTNEKIVFQGTKENRMFPINKILSVETFTDGAEVTIESRTKSVIFTARNPYILSAILHIVRSVKDPMNLKDVKLDIKFE